MTDPAGAGIYANIIWGYVELYWWDPWHTIYSSTVRIRHGLRSSYSDGIAARGGAWWLAMPPIMAPRVDTVSSRLVVRWPFFEPLGKYQSVATDATCFLFGIFGWLIMLICSTWFWVEFELCRNYGKYRQIKQKKHDCILIAGFVTFGWEFFFQSDSPVFFMAKAIRNFSSRFPAVPSHLGGLPAPRQMIFRRDYHPLGDSQLGKRTVLDFLPEMFRDDLHV